MTTGSNVPAPKDGGLEGDDGFDDARSAILDEALMLAPFDGWTTAMMREAARAADRDEATRRAAFPGGVADLLEFWSRRLDAQMHAAIKGPDAPTERIRAKVAFALNARLDLLADHREAARRAAATAALPLYAGLAPRLVWATADTVWRALGDTSTDYNFYSKRTILSGVWSSTFLRWLSDETDDLSATRAFLDARIENVMQFEKAKARVQKLGIDPGAAIGVLARLRYPFSARRSSAAR
ncbi:MAG: COQ9 family protein [Pseudomonadota bacterium]